jgi:tetratricopeptide (TPR) repeat protein
VPSDAARIDSAFVAQVAEGRSLETSGQLFDAYRRYGSIVEDFRDFHDTAEPQARVGELGKSDVVRQTAERLEEAANRHDAYLSKLRAFFDRFRQSAQPPRLEKSLRELQIAELKRAAGDTRNSIAAFAAQRLLERVFVFSSFYEPRGYLDRGDAARALALLAIAEEVRPDDPTVCYSRARALAQLGRVDDALRAVECLVQAGWVDSDRLEADANLESLRDDPGFRAVLARLRARETSRPSGAPR